MSTDGVRALVRRDILEVWAEGNLDAVDELYAADCVIRSPFWEIRGSDAFKQHIARFHGAYDRIQMRIEDVLVDADRAAVRLTLRARHVGQTPGEGLPATGREFASRDCFVYHLAEGRIVEAWVYTDRLEFLEQLGYTLVPPQKSG
jgi:steroid delta-isomerase-like uncharacterized protein